MTDAMPLAERVAGAHVIEGEHTGPLTARLGLMALGYAVLVIVMIVAINVPGATDYVGIDNDDVMRLVTVRDLLNGQGWFDPMQYRLGLEGGTLMHWSRLVDLPIAALVSFFGLFLAAPQAEVVALAVWPLALLVPLFYAMGLAGKRIGGAPVMHLSLGMTAIFALTTNRFLPGSIDHHNVQLVLVAITAAMLVDRSYRAASYATAGVMMALAIAIGAETTPLVAVVALIVAVLWAWHGEPFAAAARAFSLALALTITAAFVATVPPRLYAMVTCDSLSIGFYGLATLGGALLFVSTHAAHRLGRAGRFAVLGGNAVVLAGAALVFAPQCLGSPLGHLDPLLVSLWLDQVTEARSFLAVLRTEPSAIGGYYAVGALALAVCAVRIVRRDNVELHSILALLLAVCFFVALIQVRGAVFSNLLAILPLSFLIAELRGRAHADPDDLGAGLAYFTMAVISVPAVWAVGGALAVDGVKGLFEQAKNSHLAARNDCTSRKAMEPLAGLPPGVVAAPSELGVDILRFTHHRVLSAPYHRNEGGMLTELHIGLATPEDAIAFLYGADVGYIAFCASDTQTRVVAHTKPDGLYANLAKGTVPPYLEALPVPASGLQIFKVLRVQE